MTDDAAEPRPDSTAGRRRPGRWRTGEESRRRILDAARSCFARYGYDRTTIRRIAAEARVDPAMAYYFFGNKPQLFAAAMALPVNPGDKLATTLEGGLEGLGSRIARHFLQVWDSAGGVEPLFALMRSATTDERSAGMFKEFIQRELVGRLRRAIDAPDAHLRAELVGSHLMGMALARYVIRIEPLASAPPEEIVALMGPVLQRYLSGRPPKGEPPRGEQRG